ncbi:hypothetical protein GpartN1_g5628.t1 [Galdieria partita]|uniref:Calcium binding protein 39 n=1 Tax=Galdieria partita TaxID=83374 RepID=A0A9C7PW31_9RHOD|nr:hypothetical protein GpartN1_g2742.t1 [Galdieria partita]GJQ13837.1 hypothetical protein GpartN1_g5628.t1 [Galdieria partita]
MLSFFSKKRSISDDAQKCIQNISILIDKDIQSDTYDIDKVRLEVSKFLGEIKNILLRAESEQSKSRSLESVPEGETVSESSGSFSSVDKEAATEITAIAGDTDFLLLLAQGMQELDFEARKDAAQVFNNILRRCETQRLRTSLKSAGSPVKPTALDRIANTPQILEALIKGYEHTETALPCGSMLRECIRHETLAEMMLYSDLFGLFLDYIESNNFDVASDAFASFKDLLTKHKQVVSKYLQATYDRVMNDYFRRLLQSSNYVTRRQSLRLLGSLLTERANLSIMRRYISETENLKIVMNLLLDRSQSIQFEAFQIFKIFVANPSKPKEIEEILLKNKEQLLKFLEQFHKDKADEQFQEDRQMIIEEIRNGIGEKHS